MPSSRGVFNVSLTRKASASHIPLTQIPARKEARFAARDATTASRRGFGRATQRRAADSICEMLGDTFHEFPGYNWVVHSGEWALGDGFVSGSHDQWSEGYWAVSRSDVTYWPDRPYFTDADVSFGAAVTGTITIFDELEENLEGYALSLEGDLDRLRLWKARIAAVGTVEDLGTAEDTVYTLGIAHPEDAIVKCRLDDVEVLAVPDSSYSQGIVAMGYTGAGSGDFHFMCVTEGSEWFAPCFLGTAFGLSAGRERLLARYLLLTLITLVGLVGIAHEARSRAWTCSRT